ncbi:AcrB/AcrD/AcrF family protein [Sesbania bispinosa]|nr:AcrB/AcrD/AcrF family protein [Sesbania bispinosa]
MLYGRRWVVTAKPLQKADTSSKAVTNIASSLAIASPNYVATDVAFGRLSDGQTVAKPISV